MHCVHRIGIIIPFVHFAHRFSMKTENIGWHCMRRRMKRCEWLQLIEFIIIDMENVCPKNKHKTGIERGRRE